MNDTRNPYAPGDLPVTTRRGDIQGPAWDLSDEYTSLDAQGFLDDRRSTETLASRIGETGSRIRARLGDAPTLAPETDSVLLVDCISCAADLESARILHGNLSRYVNCVLSVDGSDARARELRGELAVLGSKLDVASGALDQLLLLCPEIYLAAFLDTPGTAPFEYGIRRARRRADRRLSLPEENALAAMRPDGHGAWSALYDTLTGTMTVRIDAAGRTDAAVREDGPGGGVSMGLAQAASLLRDDDRSLREAAFRGINAAFGIHRESCASILNAIAGWRHTENGLRSSAGPVHFLDAALDANHLSGATLDAMMSVVDASSGIGRRALALQAGVLGVRTPGPWDLLAAAPRSTVAGEDAPGRNAMPFEDAIALIANAYGAVDPGMGDFVVEMARARRIEGRSLPGKRPGAYCTGFPKSRRSRVYMVYRGSLNDVSTLAHEIGHAWHGRVLESLPLAETRYPMCLAETASTFGEALVGEALSSRADTDREALEVEWGNAQDAATFLLNIPLRFAFEKAFYEARAERPVGPEALDGLMRKAFGRYYGDALCEPDPAFWCSKLHFYMTAISFYNFPYTFGYLFSLGLLARKETMGDAFPGAYAALLRDTGRMDVEEVASRHLGVDLTSTDFWNASVAIVERNVARFASLIDTVSKES